MSIPETSAMSKNMQACIQSCADCHRVCLETLAYCLDQGGPHSESDHLRLLLDCAEICQTSANFMLRGSDLHPMTCEVCSEVCAECGDSCERFDEDRQMQRCAEICRKCAEMCQTMAEEAGVE